MHQCVIFLCQFIKSSIFHPKKNYEKWCLTNWPVRKPNWWSVIYGRNHTLTWDKFFSLFFCIFSKEYVFTSQPMPVLEGIISNYIKSLILGNHQIVLYQVKVHLGFYHFPQSEYGHWAFIHRIEHICVGYY